MQSQIDDLKKGIRELEQFTVKLTEETERRDKELHDYVIWALEETKKRHGFILEETKKRNDFVLSTIQTLTDKVASQDAVLLEIRKSFDTLEEDLFKMFGGFAKNFGKHERMLNLRSVLLATGAAVGSGAATILFHILMGH